MLQESQFLSMLKEVESALAEKAKKSEDIKEIYERYGLTAAGYRIRRATELKRNPEAISKYIFKKKASL